MNGDEVNTIIHVYLSKLNGIKAHENLLAKCIILIILTQSQIIY